MKNILRILMVILFFYSCNDKVPQDPQENYDKLFPWKGIESPESAYEDMDVKLCNTEQLINDYKYLGKDLPNKRVYTVKVVCSFKESLISVGSRYEFRFVGADKKIVVLGTKSTQLNISHLLKGDAVFTKTFKVESGYPMYLYVNGGGNRFSSIRASITAVSEDGAIVVPILSTEQHQNKMGFNNVEKPYCEYIILP